MLCKRLKHIHIVRKYSKYLQIASCLLAVRPCTGRILFVLVGIQHRSGHIRRGWPLERQWGITTGTPSGTPSFANASAGDELNLELISTDLLRTWICQICPTTVLLKQPTMTRLDTVQRGATVGHHGTPWDTVGRKCLRCPRSSRP
jgi:hypothetical protein